MAHVNVPSHRQSAEFMISPGFARISMAAAIALGLKPGGFYRNCTCGCINLLQNYPEGCFANCTYCGLARERPGSPEDNSFIRVSWPVFPTELIASKVAELELTGPVGRVCISQVQDHRSNADLLTMIGSIRRAAPTVPIAALVNATTMSRVWLESIHATGVTNIGIGLDAATEGVFDQTRGRGTKGPHTWEKHWEIVRIARQIFGPGRVNCHIIVGLGETDRDLIGLFAGLKGEQVEGYLFSFNPEPGTMMQHRTPQSITRHRRVQLVKHLIEEFGVSPSSIIFDSNGSIRRVDAHADVIEEAISSGTPFMTDGCPDRRGMLACNRPFGSYRPGEAFRDYPFFPGPEDFETIRAQLRIEEICPEFV